MVSLRPVTVLIETYWNVKLKGVTMTNDQLTVLVETYWNVKA